ITSGTPLSATQLNASANVPGAFAYEPPLNTVLPVGDNQALSVIFTPFDLANVAAAGSTVHINVTGATPAAYTVSSTSYAYRTIDGTNLNLTDDSAATITSPFPILFGGGS